MKRVLRLGRDLGPALRFVAAGTMLYLATSVPAVHRRVVDPFTDLGARVWGGSLRLLGEKVIQTGPVVTDPAAGFSLKLMDGCNGLFASIILVAAVMAHRASLIDRLLGAAFGLVGVFFANQVRLAVLFWIGRGAPDYLEAAHVYVGPAAMVLLALALWFGWAEWVRRRRERGRAQA